MAFRLNLPSRRSNPRDIVGLDIEPGFAVAVRAAVNGDVRVRRAAGIELDLDIVREGEVLDVDGLAQALRELFADRSLSRVVRLGLANQRTVLRTLDLPPIADRKELAAAVNFQAQDEVPMPLHNAVLDFQPLEMIETRNGLRQRVVLVAAQRDMVQRLLEAARAAGLRPVGVDLAAFAMIRALHRPCAAGPERLVYLSMGGLTNMAIAEGTVCRFTRVLGGGLETMAADVAARHEISLAQARSLLMDVDLTVAPGASTASAAPGAPGAAGAFAERGETGAPAGTEQAWGETGASFGIELRGDGEPDDGRSYGRATGEATLPEHARSVVANGVRDVAGEVRNSLDFQSAQDGGEQASAVVLSGPVLAIRGFAESLERELGMPVRASRVAAVDGAQIPVALERTAVAAGLATEVAPS